jgi:hypothetical protein
MRRVTENATEPKDRKETKKKRKEEHPKKHQNSSKHQQQDLGTRKVRRGGRKAPESTSLSAN